jgi:hypothetical protein
MTHEDEFVLGNALPPPLLFQIFGCLVQLFISHREGTPVHADAALDAQLLVNAQCFLRRYMGIAVLHRVVRANSDRGEIEAVKTLRNVGDVF